MCTLNDLLECYELTAQDYTSKDLATFTDKLFKRLRKYNIAENEQQKMNMITDFVHNLADEKYTMKTDLELLLRNYFDLFQSEEWGFVVLFTDSLLQYICNIDYTATEKLYYMKIKEYTKKLYGQKKGVYIDILNFAGAKPVNVEGRQPFDQFISYYKYILNYFPTVEICKFTFNLINEIAPLIRDEKNLALLKSLKNRNDRITRMYDIMFE